MAALATKKRSYGGIRELNRKTRAELVESSDMYLVEWARVEVKRCLERLGYNYLSFIDIVSGSQMDRSQIAIAMDIQPGKNGRPPRLNDWDIEILRRLVDAGLMDETWRDGKYLYSVYPGVWYVRKQMLREHRAHIQAERDKRQAEIQRQEDEEQEAINRQAEAEKQAEGARRKEVRAAELRATLEAMTPEQRAMYTHRYHDFRFQGRLYRWDGKTQQHVKLGRLRSLRISGYWVAVCWLAAAALVALIFVVAVQSSS